MASHISRLLLAAAAAVVGFGGAMHAAAFASKAAPALNASHLPPFVSAEFKVLWLADSTTLIALALVFGFIAARPSSAAKSMVVILAAIPAATAVLLYLFLGPFYAGHMLMVASAMIVAAGLLMPSQDSAGSRRGDSADVSNGAIFNEPN